MLSSNFSRLIIAHYFKYNNIFEKKKGGGCFGLMDPYMMHLGLFFFFLPARKSKKLQLKVNMQYQVSIKLLVYYGG